MKNFLKNKIVKICLAFASLIVLFFLLLPFGVSYYITDWLVKHGASAASIETIRFNPFLGRVTVRGLDIKDMDKELLRHSTLIIDVGLSSFFQRDFRIESAEYQGLFIDLQQYEDGSWRYGSIKIEPGETTEAPPEDASQPGNKWGIIADHIALTDCKARLQTQDMDLTIDIEKAELNTFSTRQNEKSGTLTLKGSINGSPVAIELNKLQITPDLTISGKAKISGYILETLAHYLEKTLPVFQGALSLDGNIDLNISEKSGLVTGFDGKIAFADTRLANDDFATEADALSWQGAISYTAPPAAPATVVTDGKLLAENYSLKLPATKFSLQQKQIALDGKTDVLLGDAISISSNGSLNLGDLNLQLPQFNLSEDSIRWEGRLNYNTASPESLTADGSIDIGKLQFQSKQNEELTINVDSMRLTQIEVKSTSSFTLGRYNATKLDVALPGGMPLSMQLAGVELKNLSTEDLGSFAIEETALDDFQAISTLSKTALARFDKLLVSAISAGTNQSFSAHSIALHKLSVLEEKSDTQKAIIALAAIDLENFQWSSQSGLQGQTLKLTDFTADILRDREGAMNISKQLTVMKAGQTQADDVNEQNIKETENIPNAPDTTGANEKQQQSPVRFQEILMTGNSRLTFEDQTLTVPYLTNFDIKQIRITDLDSTRETKQLTLLVEGNLENRAPMRISGDLSPFQQQPAINLDLLLKNYPLTSLSPYTVQSVGTALSGGNLKVTGHLNLQDNILDLSNTVLLENMQTDTISAELAAELNNQLPVPLDAALAMLRDSDGNITLDIPLSGPLEDLDVGISDIVITALSKSIVASASSYFIYTLGPYAALAYVGMKVGEEMMRVDLPPVNFAPGEMELSKEHTDYLVRIAKILTERPETDVQITPVVASGDLISETGKDKNIDKKGNTQAEKAIAQPVDINTEQRNHLLELGQTRALAIQNYLTETHSIDKTRLLISATTIETKVGAQPSVTIELK